MSETKDPAFKLFGKTIAVPQEEITASLDDHQPQEDDDDHDEMDMSNERNENKERDQANQTVEDLTKRDRSLRINKNSLKTLSMDKEITAAKATKPEEEQSETSTTKEKTMKKPNKILPCPRCNSLDTKFCYYNNYNVNQPRHFCKNCQRYWTAGGTMRNVPVGAGRRKNKSSTSHYRQITVPEALRTHPSESIHNPSLRPNGNVLNFGLDVPLCESMASIFNLTEKTMQNCHRNRFHITEEARIPVSLGGGKNGEELSSGSPVTGSNPTQDAKCSTLQESAKQNCHGFPPQIPYFAGAPWNHPWNSAQWGSPVLPPPALLPPSPSFCSSSFPVSFYPAAPYWGCPVPGTWSIPWSSPLSSSPPNTVSSGSGSNCPNLGKHSRGGNACDPDNVDTSKQSSSERGIWIPKTLRIDDPDEAAKSSIWATLGIKNDKADGMKAGGLFKAAFQSKTDENDHPVDTSQVLHANPAALSRSLNFHELS